MLYLGGVSVANTFFNKAPFLWKFKKNILRSNFLIKIDNAATDRAVCCVVNNYVCELGVLSKSKKINVFIREISDTYFLKKFSNHLTFSCLINFNFFFFQSVKLATSYILSLLQSSKPETARSLTCTAGYKLSKSYAKLIKLI